MALETQETKAALHMWHREKAGQSSSGRVEETVISAVETWVQERIQHQKESYAKLKEQENSLTTTI